MASIDDRGKHGSGDLREALKNDDAKVRLDLIPPEVLVGIGNVLTYGANKYAPHNWRKDGGFKYSRLIGAALRHIYAFARGEDQDPESGMHHLAHAMCCLIFLMYYREHADIYNKDDRWGGTNADV